MDKLIDITDIAIDVLRNAVETEKCLGLRIDIVDGGCKGKTYAIDFINEIDSSDVCVNDYGIPLYIAARALVFVIGMTIDYEKTPFSGNFVFKNPNSKGNCGCGKSFCTDENEACGGSCASCK